MTETKNPGEKTLSVNPTKTLTLNRGVEQGVVRQSFSHGRSKAVVVEKVKRRMSVPGEAKAAEPIGAVERAPARQPKAAAASPAAVQSPALSPAAAPKPSGVVLRTLTDEERNARAHALADARVREAEDRRIAEEEARRRTEREGRSRREREAAEGRKREEEDRRRHEDETKRKAEQEAKKRFGEEEAKRATLAPGARAALEAEEEEAPRTARRGAGAARPAPAPKTPRVGPEKRRGRLTLVTALKEDEERQRSDAAFRRRVQRLKRQVTNEPKEKLVREVTIPEAITIQELANRMAERAVDVIRLLMKQGQTLQITDVIDADTAQLVAEEMGHSVRRVAESDVEEGLFDTPDDPASLVPRPPVVTIMGHVDHGKTSLLDAIRSTEVAAGEAGGITQHIGAYQVTAPSGAKITFIDTPGHAAFTAMRARGAKVTDIVVLVVAADDGVMPQTVEAIHHAKAAKVPMIVAINKIDKPDAKPERVRTELLQYQVQVESLGGEVLDVEVSATKKINLDKLLETLDLQAEILDLKANPDRPAEGTVIEAKLDRGRGPVATVLVQRGTLRGGDIVVAGAEWGRVRALINDAGANVDAAGPSVPVEVLGFTGTPEAGDRLAVVETEGRAREVTAYRARQKRVIHAGVGGINESDVTLAEAAGAAIIGFNVRAHKEAREAAEHAGIEIRYYNIIYNLVDDVKKAMSGLLPPTLRETTLGNAEILEIFNVSKVGKVAGCRVTDGTVERGANVRLIRDNVVIHEGKLSQLKHFKDDAREVRAGQECGMAFENFQDMRPGDTIECYRVETVQRSL